MTVFAPGLLPVNDFPEKRFYYLPTQVVGYVWNFNISDGLKQENEAVEFATFTLTSQSIIFVAPLAA